jgi:hypothetical protein
MRYYSDLEIELLIEEITEAAYEAIEQAASEAAKAAALAALDREIALMREAQRLRREAEILSHEIVQGKKTARKNILIGILGGLVTGVAGTLIIGGR